MMHRGQRQHVRVEHLLRMTYQVIPPDEIEAMRQEVLHGPRILKYEWQPTPPARAAGAGDDPAAEWETPALADRLQRIERKLDALLERLGVDAPGIGEKPLYNVSLSARGLRFRDHRSVCSAGDMVYVCLELPMNPTVEVTALAETLYVVEDARPGQLSAGRDVVLEFRVIQEEARAEIERYCQLVQGEASGAA